MIKRTLYIGNPAYLSTRLKQLVIMKPNDGDLPPDNPEEMARTIPIEDIGAIILDHQQITITSGLMSSLLENNVAVVTCNHKSMPTGLLLNLDGHTNQSERFRSQIESSLPLKKNLWQQTVYNKIMNQGEVLTYATNEPHMCMTAWANSVKSGDPDNLEGRAAVYYWKTVFPDLPDFVRGREEAAPNNLLNYGYAILRAIVARALVASGLLPTLGIHHHNRYDSYCLADDIMEPYRPYVDKLIIDICRSIYDWQPIMTREIKAQLLQIPVLDVRIDGHISPLMVAVTTTTSSLAKCFSGQSRKIIYPQMW